jgi:hypothetical protein
MSFENMAVPYFNYHLHVFHVAVCEEKVNTLLMVDLKICMEDGVLGCMPISLVQIYRSFGGTYCKYSGYKI